MAALPAGRRVADVRRVGDHVGAVDVIDGLAFRKSRQVPVVENLIAQLRLRERAEGTVDLRPRGRQVWRPRGRRAPPRSRLGEMQGQRHARGLLMVSRDWVPGPRQRRPQGPKEACSLSLHFSPSPSGREGYVGQLQGHR